MLAGWTCLRGSARCLTGALPAAALLLLAAGATGHAGDGALGLSCRDGRVDLDARSAPAAEVFRALERDCGLVVRSPGLLPPEPVTFTSRGRTLEETVAELVRVAGVPSTLSATAPGEPLTLFLLPTGKQGPAPPAALARPAPVGDGVRVDGDAERSPGAAGAPAAQSVDPAAAILAELERIDPDQAWILSKMEAGDLLAERDEAATEDLLRRYHASPDAAERARLLDELSALGPSEVTGRPWTAADVADERWRLSWEGARRAWLIAEDDVERQAAMDLLRRENDGEAGRKSEESSRANHWVAPSQSG